MTDNKVKKISFDYGKLMSSDNKAKSDVKENYENLSKEVLVERLKNNDIRSAASSEEGKRLAAKNRELENQLIKQGETLARLEPIMPVVNRLFTDQEAVELLKAHIDGKPVNKEDDDVFDDKVKRAETVDLNQIKQLIQETVVNVLGNYDQKTAKRTNLERQKEELLKNNPSLNEEKIDEIIENMKNRELTLEDIVWLGGKENILKTISEQTAKADAKQVQNVSQFPDFAGGIKSGKEKVEPGEALLSFAEAIAKENDPMSQVMTGQ